jgi:hypothetical protein
MTARTTPKLIMVTLLVCAPLRADLLEWRPDVPSSLELCGLVEHRESISVDVEITATPFVTDAWRLRLDKAHLELTTDSRAGVTRRFTIPVADDVVKVVKVAFFAGLAVAAPKFSDPPLTTFDGTEYVFRVGERCAKTHARAGAGVPGLMVDLALAMRDHAFVAPAARAVNEGRLIARAKALLETRRRNGN